MIPSYTLQPLHSFFFFCIFSVTYSGELDFPDVRRPPARPACESINRAREPALFIAFIASFHSCSLRSQLLIVFTT